MRLSFSPGARRLTFLDSMGLLGAVGLLVGRYLPVARLPFWHCAFREHTGWPCPGCGLTRAADRLAHFHWASAFQANPLGAAVGLTLGLVAVYSALRWLFRLPEPQLEVSDAEATRARWVLLGVLVCNWAFVAVQTRMASSGS